ncbi:ABC transporter permease [Agromyces sp. SYSU T00194]|uniref:ABC transporter permease n=1 Tax=Agromyces chitinivorans TaxID=3158560 RepID=UPI0033935B83
MPRETPTVDDHRRLEAGLDRLQTSAPATSSALGRFTASALPPVVFVALLLVAWQAAVVLLHPTPAVLPAPAAVAGAVGAAWASGVLPAAVATSLSRAAVGFALAIVVGTLLGLLLAEVRPIRRAVGPVVSGLMVLPSVAWVPAATLWFGLSDALVTFVVLMGGVPSIALGLVSGVDQVPPQLRRVGRVLGAGRVRQAVDIVFPAALPGYLAGLRQGWAFSWRGVLAAEIIAVGGSLGTGVGALLQGSREATDLAGVLGAILVILAIGIAVELALLSPVERRVLRGRGLAPGGAS